MSSLPYGIYEEIVNCLTERHLSSIDRSNTGVQTSSLDRGDSHVALAEYLKHVIADALDCQGEDDRLARQIELCNRVIQLLHDSNQGLLFDAKGITPQGLRLLSVYPRHGVSDSPPERPDTPLAFGCLLTGTRLDPSLVSQIRKEMRTADHVDILCSFIKWSGLRIIEDELQQFTSRPHTSLRLITTSYMGATDLKAIDRLGALPNTTIRVSYDTHRTRLHAKAYIFHRDSRYGSAYIGSANLSHAALTEGLEWTVKVSQAEAKHLWEKLTATFETYWCDPEFTPYDASQRERLRSALQQEQGDRASEDNPYIFELHPYTFQQEILDRLEAERTIQARNRHLVVAATGTGKTMVAAFDYHNWCRSQGRIGRDLPRLLFVAHREEILRQSRSSFRAVLRDHNFGELLVGGSDTRCLDHLFVSIQSYNSRQLADLPTHFYDYVVVDEFHHAAAQSYERLLEHVQPKVLLGLTATPERSDGLDILRFFGHHISAEIRLPDAINRKLLSPFQYFGITDAVDLTNVRWRRGGYAVEDLEAKYNGNDIRTGLIVAKVREQLLDPKQARGLGFCVSIAHAEYMAEQFCRYGIPAEALSAESSDEQRRTVQDRLRRREINFIFAVDLYNEGVDIPEVDTVLFLRPTESLTVFLQQLGRGLRLCEGKDCLTVLDFIGQAHRSFRFDLRLCALLTNGSTSLIEQVRNEFTYLPAGCSIHLEKQARQYIIENIRQAVRQSKTTLARELSSFAQGLGRCPSLGEFVDFFKLDLEDIYRRGVSWSRLCADAGLKASFEEPDEQRLTRGFRRIQHISSSPQIQYLIKVLSGVTELDNEPSLEEVPRRWLLMMHFCLWGRDWLPGSISESVERVRTNPQLCTELLEVLDYRLTCIASVAPDLNLPFVCPMAVHAQYTRDEILAALGHWTLERQPDMREGVLRLADIGADILFVTLSKTEHEFSPSTMYNDYAINEDLFHWQSQSTIASDSPTGQRYIEHAHHGQTILLFVREHKKAASLACPFHFLGPAEYVSHEGSRPVSIVWKLRHRIPAVLLRRTARLLNS